MRIAVLVLVLMLVIAISTEVDGCWASRRRASKPNSQRKSETTSCKTCRRKRSVELGEEIYPEYDSLLLSDKWQPLRAAVPKSRQKRALKKLKFPGDCSSAKLQNFAKKCGFCIVPGSSHIKICGKGNSKITVIPHSVKSNGTCRNIINILNGKCI